MVEDQESKKRMILGVSIIAIVVIVIYSIIRYGAEGAFTVIKKIIWGFVILGIIFMVGYVIFRLLQQPKVDLVANDREDIIEAGMLSRPPLLRDLYLTGDKEHSEALVGKIIGYCQIQNYSKAEEGEARDEDCFVFKTKGFPLGIFEQPKVIRCYPEEHSQLIGDVRVFCVSLIQKYGYFFPNRAFLDVERIDTSVTKEAYRGQLHEFLRDLVDVSKKASGLDSEHRKELESKKLLKIPSDLGQREERGDKR